MKKLLCLIVFLCAVTAINGCGDSPSASTDHGDNIEVGFIGSQSAESSGLDTIIITSVKALITNVGVYQSFNSEYQTVVSSPKVVNLTYQVYEKTGTSTIANGIYQRVKFTFHQPEPGEVVSDPDFNTGSASSERSSLIVTGTFNGIAFTYKMHSSITKEIFFPSDVGLDINPVSITILYNPHLWFRSSGNLVLDPLIEVNSAEIDLNISGSFRQAFLDSDHNGSPD